MLRTLSTIITGASARSEEALRDHFAIELIDQKIREAEGQLKNAKGQLALLIQRERSERRLLEQLETRRDDLMDRAREALAADREDLATEAATAIAQMENEVSLRQETVARLEGQVLRLRQSVESGHRRIVDLKQGAMTARSLKREQDMQARLGGSAVSESPVQEAEALIARVVARDDPFEQQEILKGIEDELNHDTLPSRMAEAGFGKATRANASDVLARLRAENKGSRLRAEAKDTDTA